MGSRWFPSIHGVKSRTKTRTKIRDSYCSCLQNRRIPRTLLEIVGDSGVLNSNRHDQLGLPYFTTLAWKKLPRIMQAKTYHHHGWQGQQGAPFQYLPVVFEVARLTQVLTHTIHTWHVKLTHMLHGSGIFTSITQK